MAKSIKAIECPKCGSVQKTEVRPDVFRCESCGTEYYLDNDDINVNYTVRQQPGPAPQLTGWPRAAVVGGVAVVALLMTGGLRSLLHRDPAPYYQTVPGQGSVVAGRPAEEEVTKPAPYTWNSNESLLYPGAGGRPERVIIGLRSYSGLREDSLYVSFYAAATGAELKSQPLPLVAASHSSLRVALQRFADGALYAVLNKATVYQLDPVRHTATDVTKTLFRSQPALASGVANVEFVGEDYGDGFTVFTNEGRTLNYYPLIRKVYGKDEGYDAQTGFGSLRPGSPTKTAFTFSTRGSTYPEDKLQLIKYQYRDNGGGPKDTPEFEWDDDYGGSGVFTDSDPHRKLLITPSAMRDARVLSFGDFTPGRLYFNPGVCYYDTDYVLILFRPTAAEDSPLSLQCLNARTAAIVFTLPLTDAKGSLDQALRTSAGFVLGGDRDTYVISPEGKLLHHLDPEKH
ncbi:MAG: transposase [Bacteroidota bacterium]|nr:transposase [Bacteroidota bacterium]